MLRAIVLAAVLSATTFTTLRAEEYCPLTGGTAPIPELVIGMKYAEIGPTMNEYGWYPNDEDDHPNGGANVEEDWALTNGFHELRGCAGSDPLCAYGWHDDIGNDIYIVTRYTEGENPENYLPEQKVRNFRLLCRDTDGKLTYNFN